MHAALRQLRPALIAVVILSAMCGIAYPLAVTAVEQAGWGDRADGQLIERDAAVIGSELIGHPFVSLQYFHPRPSAAGDGYDGAASSGSNLGPTNEDHLATVADRAAAYRADNDLPGDALVPVDAVTASVSGLDPHISVRNARIQARRVGNEQGMDIAVVLAAAGQNTTLRPLAILGDPGVNVVLLNRDPDEVRP